MKKKKKSINNMNYDELLNRKNELVYEGFLGVILLSSLVLGVMLLIMIRDIQLLDSSITEEYIRWWLSAYGLIALGALGIIQIFLSSVDYERCLSRIKHVISDDEIDHN